MSPREILQPKILTCQLCGEEVEWLVGTGTIKIVCDECKNKWKEVKEKVLDEKG